MRGSAGGSGSASVGLLNWLLLLGLERRPNSNCEGASGRLCPGCGFELCMAANASAATPTIQRETRFIVFHDIRSGGWPKADFLGFVRRSFSEAGFGVVRRRYRPLTEELSQVLQHHAGLRLEIQECHSFKSSTLAAARASFAVPYSATMA